MGVYFSICVPIVCFLMKIVYVLKYMYVYVFRVAFRRMNLTLCYCAHLIARNK